MSFNEEILKEYLNESGTITEIKDEFIYIILASLSKIVRQVNNLGRFTEVVLGKLDKEIHELSFKLKILQENIIQLTNAIHKIPNEVLSMQVWKSRKTFSKVTIETQQVYSCTSLPINIFEKNSANIQIPLLTVPEYYQKNLEDSSSSNCSFHPCFYCSKLFKDSISMNNGQTSEKEFIQNQNINHAGDFKNVLQCQILKKHIPLAHIPASGSEESHSYLDQYDCGSSIYIFPPNRNKCQGRSVANIFPGEQDQLHYCIGHMSNSRPRVLYGTGKGDVEFSQQPDLTHYKSNVFVNPLAPQAPPLPYNWLIQLLSSKKSSAHGVISSIRSRGTSSLLVLGRTTTLPSACSKSSHNIDLTMSPEVEFTTTSKSLECYELLKQGGLSPQDLDQKIPLLFYPSIIPLRNQSWDSVMELIDSSFIVKAQSIKSSFPNSPRYPSKLKFAHGSLPQIPITNTIRTSSAQLTRSYRVPRRSFSVPASQSPKPQISLNPLPKRSVSHLTKLIEAQSRLPMKHSKRLLYSPQAKLSGFTTTKVSTIQSLSSMKSSISRHRALAIRQYAIESAYASIMQNPSILPIMTKARKALMEAIRKGIKLRKTRPRAESEDPENEAEMIRVRRKAMGYHSGKSDSETEWVE